MRILRHIIFLTLLLPAAVFGQTDRDDQLVNRAYVLYMDANELTFTTDTTNTVITDISTAPHLIITKSSPYENAVPGDTVLYTITVHNSGNAAAEWVTVQDTLPEGLAYLSADPEAEVNGSLVSWTIENLPADDTWQAGLECYLSESTPFSILSNIAVATTEDGFAAESNPVDLTVDESGVYAAFEIEKSVDLTTAAPNDTLTYTLEYHYNGNTAGENTLLIDHLPPNLQLLEMIPPGNPADNMITWYLGTLQPGTIDSVRIMTRITGNPPSGTELLNRAVITNASGISDSDSAVCQIHVPYSMTDVNLVKSVDQELVQPGDTLQYQIIVSNTGSETIFDAVLTDSLPDELNFLNADGTYNYQSETGVIQWTYDLLWPQFSDTLMVTAAVDPEAVSGTEILNLAQISIDNNPQAADSALTAVQVFSDFLFVKDVDKGYSFTGDTLNYTVYLENTSEYPSPNTLIHDVLPDGTQFISASEGGTENLGIVSWNLGEVNPGDSQLLTISVLVTADLNLELLNVAHITNAAGVHEFDDAVTLINQPGIPRTIQVTAEPEYIPADGISITNVQALVLDVNGDRVPDGTEVILTADAGLFQNGTSEILTTTLNGTAAAPLTSVVSSTEMIPAIVTGTTWLSDLQTISDSDTVWFYPAAIVGDVWDFADDAPVADALSVTLNSSDETVWSMLTDENGQYLIPIQLTDTYRIVNSTEDIFDDPISSQHDLTVDLSEPGADLFRVNYGSISGRLTDANLQPIEETDQLVKLYLDDEQLDSVLTQANGAFAFDSLNSGTYRIEVLRTGVQPNQYGEIRNIELDSGTWLINVNPVLYELSLTVDKSTEENSYLVYDDVLYNLSISNHNIIPVTNITVTDTLPNTMEYLNSSHNGTHTDGIVQWVIPQMNADETVNIELTAGFVIPIANLSLHENVVSVQAEETGESLNSAVVEVISAPNLVLEKMGPIEAFPTDTLTYNILVMNNGSDTATNVTVSDTLAPELFFVSADNSGTYDSFSREVRWVIPELPAGDFRSFNVDVQLDPNLPDGMQVSNEAFAVCDENISAYDIATTTNVLPLTLELFASPNAILGNGVNFSTLIAPVKTFLGNPVPRSVPVTFTADRGTIDPNLVTVMTQQGTAYSQLVSEVVLNATIVSNADAVTYYTDTDFAYDTTQVIFYPSAIAGDVLDYQGNPIVGAIVTILDSNGETLGSDTTGVTGDYLVPVYFPDSYTINITVFDQSGNPITLGQILEISEDDLADNVIIPNWVSISGWVIDEVTGEVIEEAGIPVILTPVPDDGMGRSAFLEDMENDTTWTDATGFYAFTELNPGNYQLQLIYNGVSSYSNGDLVLNELVDGNYIINANIALNRVSLTAYKTVQETTANVGDTLSYRIVFGTDSFPIADTTWLIDMLPDGLEYLPESLILSEGIQFDSFDDVTNTLRFFAPYFAESEMDTVSFRTRIESDIFTGGIYDIENVAMAVTGQDSVYTSDHPATNAGTILTLPFLSAEKKASRRSAVTGDYVNYTVTVQNESETTDLTQLFVEDLLPEGFKYKTGTSYLNGEPVPDPVQTADQSDQIFLRWELADELPAGSSVKLQYRTVIGLNAPVGTRINEAVAGTETGGTIIYSAPVTAEVLVKPDSFSSRGFIFGKVFYDYNEDGLHNSAEPVLPYVELVMENGIRVVSDEYGKYSIPNVAPGAHAVRINRATLPEDAEGRIISNAQLNNPWMRKVDMIPGGMVKANFALETPQHGSLDVDVCQVPEISYSLKVSPVIYELNEFEPFELSTHYHFESGSAVLHPDDLAQAAKLARFMILQDNISLQIIGHTDNVPVTIRESYKNNQELSAARAQNIRNYLLQNYSIAPERIAAFGKGAAQPVASNHTKSGRAMNRRIELRFVASQVDQAENDQLTVTMNFEYHHSAPLSMVTASVAIPQGFRYIGQSAEFRGQPITASRTAHNLITWQLGGMQHHFNETLRFRIAPAAEGPLPHIGRISGHVEYTNSEGTVHTSEPVEASYAVAARGLVISSLTESEGLNLLSDRFSPEILETLDETAEFLKWQKHINLDILTYSANPDSPALTRTNRFGEQVKMVLTDRHGIAPDRLTVLSYGGFFTSGNRLDLSIRANRIYPAEIRPLLPGSRTEEIKTGKAAGTGCQESAETILHAELQTPEILTLRENLPLNINARFHFKSNSARLSSVDMNELWNIARLMNLYSDITLEITGHTDSVPVQSGSAYKNNYELSRARAENIQKFLISESKIDGERITSRGKGPDQPIADNATAEGRRLNRRIELQFSSEELSAELPSLEFRIPLHISGSQSIRKLEFEIPTPKGFIWAEGKSLYNHQPLKTEMNGGLITLSLPVNGKNISGDITGAFLVQHAAETGSVTRLECRVQAQYSDGTRDEIGRMNRWVHTPLDRVYLETPVSREDFIDGKPIQPQMLIKLNQIGRLLNWQPELNLTILGMQTAEDDFNRVAGWSLTVSDFLIREYNIESERIHSRVDIHNAGSRLTQPNLMTLLITPVNTQKSSVIDNLIPAVIHTEMDSHTGAAGHTAPVVIMPDSNGRFTVRLVLHSDSLPDADQLLGTITIPKSMAFTRQAGDVIQLSAPLSGPVVNLVQEIHLTDLDSKTDKQSIRLNLEFRQGQKKLNIQYPELIELEVR